jgi:lipopolysaccharide assembly protein A
VPVRVLIWIVRLIVVGLLVWFAAKNAGSVTLRGFLDSTIEAPLVLILLAFFGGGLLLGLVSSLGAVFKLKREIRKLNRALSHASHANHGQQAPQVLKGEAVPLSTSVSVLDVTGPIPRLDLSSTADKRQ